MATQTLTQVRDIITRFRKTHKDIEVQAEEIKKQIEKEKREQGKYGPMPHKMEDHISHHKDYIEQQKERLRTNIQNYLAGSKHLREESCRTSIRDLREYLIPFGSKVALYDGARQPDIALVMACDGSWAKLEAIVKEELEKLPSKTWGKLSRAQRAHLVDSHKRKVKELEAALLELENR